MTDNETPTFHGPLYYPSHTVNETLIFYEKYLLYLITKNAIIFGCFFCGVIVEFRCLRYNSFFKQQPSRYRVFFCPADSCDPTLRPTPRPDRLVLIEIESRFSVRLELVASLVSLVIAAVDV